jgi:hypothetical protein
MSPSYTPFVLYSGCAALIFIDGVGFKCVKVGFLGSFKISGTRLDYARDWPVAEKPYRVSFHGQPRQWGNIYIVRIQIEGGSIHFSCNNEVVINRANFYGIRKNDKHIKVHQAKNFTIPPINSPKSNYVILNIGSSFI